MAICDYANRECGYWNPAEVECEALFIDQCPFEMDRIRIAASEAAEAPPRPDPEIG